MIEIIEEERKRIKAERRTMVKDALLILAGAIALTVFLLVWKGQITGSAVINDGNFCEDYDGFQFISPPNITLSEDNGYTYQLKLSCIPGNITFQDNSDYIDVPPDGIIRMISEHNIPDEIDAIIIAQHESGEFIYRRFNINVQK